MSSVFRRSCSISCMFMRTLRIIGSRRNRMRKDDCAPELANNRREKHSETHRFFLLNISNLTKRIQKNYKTHLIHLKGSDCSFLRLKFRIPDYGFVCIYTNFYLCKYQIRQRVHCHASGFVRMYLSSGSLS